MPRAEDGFTLVEALVALAVLAAAAGSLIAAAGLHARRIADVEGRAAARLVAEYALGRARLDGRRPDGGAATVAMLGRAWRVRVTAAPTDDPDLVLARVAVEAAGGGPGYRLDGFVDLGRRQ